MTFARKVIQVAFQLQTGTFAGTQANTITQSGLKTAFRVTEAGGVANDLAELTVWGLTPSVMASLSTYGNPPVDTFNNAVTVSAGDAQSSLGTVFKGTITSADITYDESGESALVVRALTGGYDQVQNGTTTSFSGSADVATIMGQLAGQMGLTLENSGVSVKISNPYFVGSLNDQVIRCAKAANINWKVDTKLGVLAIWPRGGARTGTTATISPTSGLVGYPTFGYQQLFFRCLYNPQIVFGKPVTIVSSVKPANGNWVPQVITTTLQSETIGGAWFQDVQAFKAAS